LSPPPALTPTKNANEKTRVFKLETSLAICTSAIASEQDTALKSAVHGEAHAREERLKNKL